MISSILVVAALCFIAFKLGQARELMRWILDERAERDRSGADSTATRSSRLYVVRSK